jgi:hypothetical protein
MTPGPPPVITVKPALGQRGAEISGQAGRSVRLREARGAEHRHRRAEFVELAVAVHELVEHGHRPVEVREQVIRPAQQVALSVGGRRRVGP